MKSAGNTILITGGGSGIGLALAERFHDLGNSVIVAGRRIDALNAAISGRERMHAMALDIDSPEAINTFAQAVVAAHPAINVLINNAGIMRIEDLTAARDLADAEAMVTTNLLGPIRLTDALIDHLAGQADPVIVNVTSGLAYVPLVGAATYSATKAAIHSYTVSLREALKGRVEVIELVPPAVQTDLTPGQSTRSGYMPLDAFIDEVMDLFARTPTPPEILVDRVRMLRDAEADGQFDHVLTTINTFVEQARAAQPD